MNECILPGTLVESDEHKAIFWLGKITNQRTRKHCRPTLCTYSIVNHSKGFKAADRTHTNKVEGCNSLIKGPHKAMKVLPKILTPLHLDQIMFECWENSVTGFSTTSHHAEE